MIASNCYDARVNKERGEARLDQLLAQILPKQARLEDDESPEVYTGNRLLQYIDEDLKNRIQ